MSKEPRILIVSAFGRQHWLAVQLVQKGFSVQLVDVTDQFGPWKAEDIEGPFGFFRSGIWSDSYFERLKQETSVLEEENGFTIWLKNGPVEFRSSLASYRLKRLGQGENIQKYVQNHDGYSQLQKKETASRLKNISFPKKWLAKFAHYLMANRQLSYSDQDDLYLMREQLCPLLDPYFIRKANKDSIEKSLNWCAAQGVVVIRQAKIPDVAISGSKVEGFEIQSEKSGFVRSQQYVWGLSSLETQFAFPKVFKKLFHHHIEPEFIWQRYQISLPELNELHLLPHSFAMLEDIDFPWTHENLMLFKRTGDSRIFDVWVLLPYSQRFQKKYLHDKSESLLAQIQQRLSLFKPTLVNLPLEANLSSKDLGGVLFPVYAEARLDSGFHKKFQNLYFDGVEVWPLLSWQGAFPIQNRIIEKINKWWSTLTPQNREKELSL